MKYITGMNRDRDNYQVAIALAEGGLLEKLVTDYYHPKAKFPIPSLSHRQTPAISPELVATVPAAVRSQLLYLARRKVLKAARFPSAFVDDAIAREIASQSSLHPSASLLVYSNYAWRSFERPDLSTLKGLFQFHPSPTIIDRGMATDELADQAPWQPEQDIEQDRREIYEREISAADLVVCASTFTAQGLELDGVDPNAIRVVPYGCPVPEAGARSTRDRTVLFVGQGIQRKGLHLLAKAWGRIDTRGWKLRVVASKIDPHVARALADPRLTNVEVSGALPKEELSQLYNSASIFVLPSLVEGFGLVLGEALAGGCRLIATTNTGLPDLDLPADVSTVIEPGSVSALAGALEQEMQRDPGDSADIALNMARNRSWAWFREGIRGAIPSPAR